MPFLPLYLYLYVLIYVAEKKIKKYVWEAKMRFRIVFLRGVYPPFNQLNNNFLPVLGHFWASLVFLFTCVAVSPLHYMYNVIRAKRLNPFTGAVFGSVCSSSRYYSLPFPFPPLLFPFLPFLSLPSGVFWVGFLGRLGRFLGRSGQIRASRASRASRTGFICV